MSETDAIGLAGENLRGASGLDQDVTPSPSKKRAKKSVASGVTQDTVEIPSEQPTSAEAHALAEPSLGSDATAADVAPPNGAASRGSEFELKLLVDAERLTDFNEAPIIAAHARSKGTR